MENPNANFDLTKQALLKFWGASKLTRLLASGHGSTRRLPQQPVRFASYVRPYARYSRGMSNSERDYAAVVRSVGAEYLGIQLGPHGSFILFTDPESRTTLAVAELEFSPQAVSHRLQESRQAFQLLPHVQESLR
jgi:hypothetical protein